MAGDIFALGLDLDRKSAGQWVAERTGHRRLKHSESASTPSGIGGTSVKRIDAHQLRQLIDTHGAALTLYARQWCNVPEDALQESLIDLLRQSPVPDQPAAWLFKTIRRRAMNLARAEQRRAKYHRKAGEQCESWFRSDVESVFEPQELEAMLAGLPQLEREIVVARIWGGLSFQQIAQLTDRSSSAMHRRYQRALVLLGQMMTEKLDKSR